ncbi:hypothetical protein Aperf_G00000116694 [Anoplocephala perfoliata]
MTSCLSLKLNNGRTIPQIGFGTFEMEKEKTIASVKEAFDAGYRHIDTATAYENEEEIGRAIAESMKKHGLKREDIFVTTKLWCDKHDPKVVRKDCEESLRKLGLDYLDLYLIHFPASFHVKEGLTFFSDDPDRFVYEYHKLEDTWTAMEELVAAGLVKSIGVSNYNKRQIEHLIKHCKIVPAVNQVEVNLHWLNTKLIEYCRSKNIVVEGYAPLGFPGPRGTDIKPILQLEAVGEIAKKHNVTPAQVVIRHGLQRQIVVLVKSVTPARIRSNIDVFGFELSEEEMDKLNKAGVNRRIIPWEGPLRSHPEYPFHDEF